MYLEDMNTFEYGSLWDSTPAYLVEAQFIEALKPYSLNRFELFLLIERFVFNKTLVEISRDQGITSTRSVDHQLQKTMETLRQRGFGLRKEM